MMMEQLVLKGINELVLQKIFKKEWKGLDKYMAVFAGIFLVFHGLVHLLYAGQSWRLFELRSGMLWPSNSWLFSPLLGDSPTRSLATIALALAALGFCVGGLGLFLSQAWWRPAAVGSTVFSSTIFLMLWNGKFQAVDEQGAVGLLINLVILGVVYLLKWPA